MKSTLKVLIALAVTTFIFTSCQTDKNELKAIYENLPFEMDEIQAIVFPNNEVIITDFGAVGNGIFDNTEAFAKAIQAVSEKGGGKVIVPVGNFITGPISFKDNINLYLEKGALITFSKDKDKYPIIKTSFEGFDTRRCTSPLNAKGVKNIAITGKGIIDGSGEVWRSVKKSKLTAGAWKDLVSSGGILSENEKIWYPSESYMKALPLIVDQNVPKIETEEQWIEIRDFLRPVMLSFVNCENILLEGVTFQNSPAWCLHPLMCTNVSLINITVKNPWFSQNGDGLDLESCKNCIIYNCSFDVGDDAICIKSGKDADGRKRAIPTENVIVSNCTVYHGHGGFVVGSEMSGGVKNIFVDNCTFLGTDAGLRFKSKRGRGGVVENIHISNIHMINIETDPIIFNLFYGGKHGRDAVNSEKNQVRDMQKVTEETPAFKDIYIKNITCNGAYRAMFFNGLPEMNVQNINIENVVITSDLGAIINESDGVNLKNIVIEAKEGPVLKLQNVKNIHIENVESDTPENDIVLMNNTQNVIFINSNIKEENIQSTNQ